MKEAKSEQAMLNSLVADYLCTKAPKIGNKFKKETSAEELDGGVGLLEMVNHYMSTVGEGNLELSEGKGNKENKEPKSDKKVKDGSEQKDADGEEKNLKTKGQKGAAAEKVEMTKESEVGVEVKKEKGSKRKSEEKNGVEEKTSAEEAENPTGSAKKKKSKKSKHGEGEAAANVANKNQDSATEEVPAQDDENQAEAPKKKKSKKTKQVEVEQIGAKDVKGARQVWEPGWWQVWYTQCSDSLFPKRRHVMQNLKVGDIVLYGADNKVGKGEYRLARVCDGNLEKKKLPVQRLELIQPIEAGTVTTKSQE